MILLVIADRIFIYCLGLEINIKNELFNHLEKIILV